MINSRDIKELHPALQRGATELLKRCAASGLNVLVTQTYRDNEYQNSLYAQGRSVKGDVVTNAKGGQSMHNYRLAFDFCKNVKGHAYDDNAFFQKVGNIWVGMGGVWGGNWTGFVDRPHCEFTNGITLKQLQGGVRVPESVKMKWESVAVNAPTVTAEEILTLQRIVFAEAGGEDLKGQILVANVILNRVKSKGKGFPDTIKGVIYQKEPSVQFSPVYDSKVNFEKIIPTEMNKQAVQKALEGEDYSQGLLYFCSVKSATAGNWLERNLSRAFNHGGHIFYKENPNIKEIQAAVERLKAAGKTSDPDYWTRCLLGNRTAEPGPLLAILKG